MQNPLADDLEEILSATKPLWEELRNSRIFITGGTGFFGCWLLETFAWANEQLQLGVQAVVLTRDRSRLENRAPHLASYPSIHLHPGDVRDFAFPAGEFAYMIHAATESVAADSADPEIMFTTIVEGTRRSLEFAKKARVRKLLFVSSGAVYGKQPAEVSHVPETFAVSENPRQSRPQTLEAAYAEGKRIAESYCVSAAQSGTLEAKIARCFAFVGPYMSLDAHFAIGNFIRDQLRGGPIVANSDGSAVRSYMYAADLMVWLWTILSKGQNCRAYNVGSEEAISIRDLAHLTAAALKPTVGVEIRGTASAAPPHRYVPSTARARTELGLFEQVGLCEAIQRTQRLLSGHPIANQAKRWFPQD